MTRQSASSYRERRYEFSAWVCGPDFTNILSRWIAGVVTERWLS